MRAALVTFCLVLTGCGLLPGPRIKVPGVTVESVKDAGKPAVLNKHDASEALTIPQGSKFVLKQKESLPATSEKPAQPAETVVEIEPSAAMVWSRAVNSISADTGTVDTSVAKYRIDADKRQAFIYIGILLIVAGLVLKSILPAWPGIPKALMLAGGISIGGFFLASQPWWVIALLAALPVVLMCAMALGYKKSDWDKDGDGTPDFLQRKP